MITLLLSIFIAATVFLVLQSLNPAWALAIKSRREALANRLRQIGASKGDKVSQLIVAGMALGGLLLYAISDSWVMGIFGALLGALFPWAYARVLEQRRLAKFSSQLASVLDMLAGSLKSGQSLSQGLQTVAAEAAQPAAGYFAVVSQKMALGGAPELGLEELAASMKGQPCEEELRMLATSVSVTRATGGNLAEILGQLSETMRERARMRAEIDSLTAQGKMSGWIVGSLPVIILVALNFLDPSLVAPMFSTPLGLGLLALGAALELIGAFLITRIVSIDL